MDQVIPWGSVVGLLAAIGSAAGDDGEAETLRDSGLHLADGVRGVLGRLSLFDVPSGISAMMVLVSSNRREYQRTQQPTEGEELVVERAGRHRAPGHPEVFYDDVQSREVEGAFNQVQVRTGRRY